VHIETVGEWIPFDTFLNSSLSLNELISGGLGSLAGNVPEPLALAYVNTLNESGLSASHSEPKLPTYWNGEKHTTDIVPISLLILGDSEIIAEKVEAKEVSRINV
jgi:hypothetical protein